MGPTSTVGPQQTYANGYAEVQNIYHDLSYPVISVGTASTMSITNVYGFVPLPNPVINGGFESWMLYTSTANALADQYTADMWEIFYGGASTSTFTVSQDNTNVDSGRYALKFQITQAGTSSLRIYQYIENIGSYLGQPMAFSCRVKSPNIGAGHIELIIDPNNGSTVNDGFSNFYSGSGNYETLIATLTVPTNASGIVIKLGMTGGLVTTGTWYADSCNAVMGLNPAPFTPTDPALDGARISRYVRTGGNVNAPLYFVALGYNTGSLFQLISPQTFEVPMASTPTISLFINHIQEEGSSTDQQANYTVQALNVSPTGFSVYVNKANTGNKPASLSYWWWAWVNNGF